MSKTAEEILLEKVLSEEQKEYGDHEFWKSQNRHEFPQYLSAMHEFAAQEVEAYKAKLKQAVIDKFDGIYVDDLRILQLIDTVK